MAVTVEIIHEHIETDLSDEAIQLLIDDATQEIESRYGALTGRMEDYELTSPQRKIFLRTQAETITLLEEGSEIDSLTPLVDGTDYVSTNNGWVVERLGTSFQRRVQITFDAKSNENTRDRVTIDLVRLAIQYSALGSLRDGDHTESALGYNQEREDLFKPLNQNARTMA